MGRPKTMPAWCQHEGCGREALSKSYCDMHYRRLRKFGSTSVPEGVRKVSLGADARERFFDKVEIKSKKECWIWQGGTRPNSAGALYGRHWTDDGKSMGAHRFSYWIATGEHPSENLVCHKCDVSLCVNPRHLFLSDHDGNMKDMTQKGRSYRARGENKKGLAKLTNKQAAEIRKAKGPQWKIAERFGVAQTTISRIKRGVSY